MILEKMSAENAAFDPIYIGSNAALYTSILPALLYSIKDRCILKRDCGGKYLRKPKENVA